MESALEKIENILAQVGNVMLAIMTVWIFSDAIGRYAFNSPIPGTLEVTEEYLMVFVVFLAMGYTQRLDGHVRADVFLTYMPTKSLPVIQQINRIATLLFAIIVIITGVQQFLSAVELKSVSRGVLAYPLAPAYLIMVLGMSVFALRLILEIITRPDKGRCAK